MKEKYSIIKYERQRNQEDAKVLEKKMKFLLLEEQKALKKEEKEIIKLEEIQKKKISYQQEKNKFSEIKSQIEKESINKKEQIFKFREKLQNALKNKPENPCLH